MVVEPPRANRHSLPVQNDLMDLEINVFPQLTVLGGMCVKLHAPRNETRDQDQERSLQGVSLNGLAL